MPSPNFLEVEELRDKPGYSVCNWRGALDLDLIIPSCSRRPFPGRDLAGNIVVRALGM